MNKEKMEHVFREAGVTPALRQNAGDYDIFVGDGFSLMPHRLYRRFGVEPTEFPKGMYVTWWWVGKDEKLDVGRPLFFDWAHDAEYSADDKKNMRILKAVDEANKFIIRRHAQAN